MTSDNETSQPNPFDPPDVATVDPETAVFGLGFWVPVAIFVCISIALCMSTDSLPIGIFLVASNVFTVIRAVLIKIRASQAFTIGVPYRFNRGLTLFLQSIALGVVASIASCIAFVAICIPAGLVAFSASLPDRFFPVGLILVAVLGLLAGVWLIRLTVPKVPQP